MNTQSNSMPQPPLESQAIAPAAMSVTRPMYWSIRRELWENRSIYIAPLIVAAVVLFGFLIATIGRAMATSNLDHRRAVLEEPYNFAIGLIMATTFIVGIFYCLDALHGERRDRSILFWKSLPVSDLTTVLSKASIPLVVLPIITVTIIVATNWVMLLMSTVVLAGSGLSAGTLWTQVSLSLLMVLYHLLTVHVLWHAPIYSWLLLVSGWARRAAFLWAILPWAAICVVEKIAFNTSHFANLLQYRFTGPEAFDFPARGSGSIHPMTHFALGQFLSTPGLWIGFLLAAAFLAAAVRLRRYRGPM